MTLATKQNKKEKGFNNELQTSTRDTLSNCGISEESETQVYAFKGSHCGRRDSANNIRNVAHRPDRAEQTRVDKNRGARITAHRTCGE